MSTFVLLHSPLGSIMTWAPVAERLRQRKQDVLVPRVLSTDRNSRPFWRQHLRAVQFHLRQVPTDEGLILVAHSGAGVLLPAIRDVTRRPVLAYIFVDAAIPEDGKSRLDLFSTKKVANAFRKAADSGVIPVPPESALEGLIADAALRRQYRELTRPLPLGVYEEPIPVFKGWPDAACAYIQFSGTYDDQAAEAKRRGWPVERVPGDHLHMLVDPESVTEAVIRAANTAIAKKK